MNAASICPALRMASASPSTSESTGKGCQQQPSQGKSPKVTSQQPARARARARAWGLRPGPLPSSQHFSPRPSLPPSPRSFCWEHRPRQAAVAAPAEDTSCVICQETVGDCPSYHTLVCPACTHTWFHRACIQVGALPSPCRHAWCSAAPGTAHTHAACASRAATCLECWHGVLPLPRLQRQYRLLHGNVHHGDPNPSQVGVLLPNRPDGKARALGLPAHGLLQQAWHSAVSSARASASPRS